MLSVQSCEQQVHVAEKTYGEHLYIPLISIIMKTEILLAYMYVVFHILHIISFILQNAHVIPVANNV